MKQAFFKTMNKNRKPFASLKEVKASLPNILSITFILLMTIMFTFQLSAQEEREMKTIFGSTVTHGGYGGFSINYSSIDDRDAMVIGGRGAWIINHHIGIGMAGYGFFNDMDMDDIYDNSHTSLAGGYGGLLIEPVIAPYYPVHLAFPILIGAGGISYLDNYYWSSHDSDWESRVEDTDAFFVIEPGIELEMNLIKFMKISLGAYYRYTDDIELINTKEDALKGFSGGITFKFGKF